MALQIVGAGLGRTGTKTLKDALEMLGFAPCHHMVEVFAHPEQRLFWLRAAQGEQVDWEELFAHYKASVDWPSCHFYKELAARYPDAKVLLSVRDPVKWYESMESTILDVTRRAMAQTDPVAREGSRFIEMIVAEKTFNYDFSKENVIAAFERHNAEVKRTIPPERLLVYEASQGWEPLCKFLDVPIPATPFPHTNTRDEFRSRAGRISPTGPMLDQKV